MLRKTKVYVKAMIRKVFLIFKPCMGTSNILAAQTEIPLRLGYGGSRSAGCGVFLPSLTK